MTIPIPTRPATSADRPAIRALALDNAMFEPEEMQGFDEMLDGFLDGSADEHAWLVAGPDDSSDVLGAVFYAPEPFSDRLWNLYFLATHPDHHRSGIGSTLLGAVETALLHAGDAVARILIIDTSSTDQYRSTRAFYARHHYSEEARIRDFYGPGDDKVTYWKALAATGTD